MTYRNGVRVDSQQLRDIQDLISKLEDVNKQLALPLHAVPLSQVMEPETADAASLDRGPRRAPSGPLRPRAIGAQQLRRRRGRQRRRAKLANVRR